MAADEAGRGSDEAMARAVGRLALAWFWWFVLGSVQFPVSVLFGAWVLYELHRLTAETSGVVATRLRLAFAVGLAAAWLSLVTWAVDPHDNDAVGWVGSWVLVASGIALFCLAIRDWTVDRGCDAALTAAWQRSFGWAVAGTGAAAVYTVAEALAGGELHGRPDTLVAAAVVVTLLGVMLSVARATIRLKDGLGRQRASWLA